MEDFKIGDHVTVRRWRGVACRVMGFETLPNKMCTWCDGDGFDHTGVAETVDCSHCHGYGEFVGPITGKLEICMVGDDTVHVVSPDDCTVVSDDEFCASCGQIGCGH